MSKEQKLSEKVKQTIDIVAKASENLNKECFADNPDQFVKDTLSMIELSAKFFDHLVKGNNDKTN